MQRLKRCLWLGTIGMVGGLGLSVVVVRAAASYPGAVKSFTTKTDGSGQTIFAAHINDLQDEVVAMEQALLNGFAHNLRPDATANNRTLGDASHLWGLPFLAGGSNGQVLQTNGSGTTSWASLVPTGCAVRLTLTLGTPVTTTDATAATSVYVTPYGGSVGQPAYCAFYNGSAWVTVAVTEQTIAVPATTSQMYDVFCFNSSGTMACDAAVAWTNDTTRATALVLQNGDYVKSGDATRRYMGSFRTTTVSGQTEDSAVKRYVWSYYNRVRRELKRLEATTSWTYNTNAWRQANASTSNQVDFVIGVSEQPVTCELSAFVVNSAATTFIAVAMGLDGAGGSAGDQHGGVESATTNVQNLRAVYSGYPGIGRHFLAWIERAGSGAGTVTWYSNSNPFGVSEQSGLLGWIEG